MVTGSLARGSVTCHESPSGRAAPCDWAACGRLFSVLLMMMHSGLRRLGLLVLAGALGVFAGCGDDGGGGNTVVDCGEECEPGETRCSGDDVEVCGFDADSCREWVAVQTCGPNLCDDGECQAGCFDADGDGYGENCQVGPDCDDTNPDKNEGASERCNNSDDDCDSLVDEGATACDTACDPPV